MILRARLLVAPLACPCSAEPRLHIITSSNIYYHSMSSDSSQPPCSHSVLLEFSARLSLSQRTAGLGYCQADCLQNSSGHAACCRGVDTSNVLPCMHASAQRTCGGCVWVAIPLNWQDNLGSPQACPATCLQRAVMVLSQTRLEFIMLATKLSLLQCPTAGRAKQHQQHFEPHERQLQ